MEFRFYFKEAIASDPRLKRSEGKTTFDGVTLYSDNGVFYAFSFKENPCLHSSLKSFVTRVTLEDGDIPVVLGALRERGQYGLGRTTATLDFWRQMTCYKIVVVGQSYDKVIKLYDLIRGGKIAPEVSWENEQEEENDPLFKEKQAAQILRDMSLPNKRPGEFGAASLSFFKALVAIVKEHERAKASSSVEEDDVLGNSLDCDEKGEKIYPDLDDDFDVEQDSIS